MKVERKCFKSNKKQLAVGCRIIYKCCVSLNLRNLFPVFVSGGYQGGRNPTYGIRFLMDRSGWDTLHTWGGVIMIVVALAHLIYHWHWVVSMTRRVFRDIFSNSKVLNAKGRWNVFIDVMVGPVLLLRQFQEFTSCSQAAVMADVTRIQCSCFPGLSGTSFIHGPAS